jgi:hypothetical protein
MSSKNEIARVLAAHEFRHGIFAEHMASGCQCGWRDDIPMWEPRGAHYEAHREHLAETLLRAALAEPTEPQ